MTPYRSIPAGPAARRGGFSLIEILVVVAIIAVLMGAVLAGASKFREHSAVSLTKVILGGVAGVEVEYRTQTGKFANPVGGLTYANPNDTTSIKAFIDTVYSGAPTAAELFQSINPDFTRDLDSDGKIDVIVDAWKRPLRYAVGGNPGAGLPYRLKGGRIDTTTGQAASEAMVYFASAGPDGLWGKVDPDTNEPDSDAADNIYSFKID